MPYSKISQLPQGVKTNLPKGAQEIYKEAFNHAWDQYKDESKRHDADTREETAHKVAWSAVKRKYSKKGGQWQKN